MPDIGDFSEDLAMLVLASQVFKIIFFWNDLRRMSVYNPMFYFTVEVHFCIMYSLVQKSRPYFKFSHFLSVIKN